MNTIGILFADGFEEIEAITITDILRRADFDVLMIGVTSSLPCGSHGIRVKMDRVLADIDPNLLDAVVLPGGMPGSKNLSQDSSVLKLLKQLHSKQKIIGAICAAPIALSAAGIADDRRLTCYPSFQDQIPNSTYTGEKVTVDGNIITGSGAGTAMEFSLKLVEILGKPECALELSQQLLFN